MCDNKKITTNSYIDFDMCSSCENLLIVGNTTGFFGEFIASVSGVEVDFMNTNPAVISRLSLLGNILKNDKSIKIVANKETFEYYRLVFSFIRQKIYKFNKKNIQFKVINNDTEYIEFFNKLINKDMKFDYIIQNPPYSGSFHLQFLEKGLELLSDKGKMTIIEPARWLMDIRRDNKKGAMPYYNKIISKTEGHIYKIIIENYNKEFQTGMIVPFSVTYIDMNKIYDKIDFYCFGEHRIETDIRNCNIIGNYQIIWSILNKIKGYGDIMKNHIYKEGKTVIDDNTWFCKYAEIIGNIGCSAFCGSNLKNMKSMNPDIWYANDIYYINNYLCGYYNCLYHNIANDIQNIPLHACKAGGKNGSHKLSDKIGNNLYGTKQELENWKHFVFNNKIPLFTSIVLVIDQHNTCKDVLCWLTDKQYTDEEIYQLLGITEEEKQFIDKTLKKYERNSPWFKRYLCGKDSVSDEEVQKFIDSL